MMEHLTFLPVIVPFVAGIIILAIGRLVETRVQALGLIAMGINLVVAVMMFGRADGNVIDVYKMGSWDAPFGIVLVADRLSSLMVLITGLIALPALASASGDFDDDGPHFHAFFQFQVAGLNGAFLTGDLFNLFVFFEVLLIASYALLMHSGGKERALSGLQYVVLNLAGSTLFLFALGLMYSVTGTLNLADLAQRIPNVPEGDQALLRVALILLTIVFVLKAALAPLCFWLPRTYPTAHPAVAALFAVMTKVGVYALFRVATGAFGAAEYTASLLDTWLMPLALLTIALGTFGLFSVSRLSAVTSHLVLISSGTLLAALAFGGPQMMKAIAFYLPHTVLCTAAMFLIVGEIAARRGVFGDDFAERGAPVRGSWLGFSFFISAIALAGMPPLSGFLGKWLMLMATPAASPEVYAFWAALILSGFGAALVLARSGSRFFWEPLPETPAIEHYGRTLQKAALVFSITIVVLMTVGASAIEQYADRTAEQLGNQTSYRQSVVGESSSMTREVRP